MDHYVFNLDLDTWGLTTKQQELDRFKDYIDENILKHSNALFGYEGDKYYFDIDIRKHFGLDKYNTDIIPYWKTETIDAMDAFVNKPNYTTGAGECVSLSTLYAAALFIVARIPLKDIFLIATPLHSQNYVNIDDGVLTNNRRIVTKNMWFNGTAISAKARRALEKERITIVAHETGYIHIMHNDMTISPESYSFFRDKLQEFLRINLTSRILGNFTRFRRDLHGCLQLRWNFHGKNHYIGLERLFEYETQYPYVITDETRKNLLNKIDNEEFHTSPIPGRIILNDLEDYIEKHNIDFSNTDDIDELKVRFAQDCLKPEVLIQSLKEFCITEPAFPAEDKKTFLKTAPLGISTDMDRDTIIKRLESIREENSTADLAFYAYRDFSRTSPLPFLKAAMQRNPVSINTLQELDNDSIFERIQHITDVSIYDEDYRLAQPDEIWNYQTGDGIEKAVLFANILQNKNKSKNITIEISQANVLVKFKGKHYNFSTSKKLKKQTWHIGQEILIEELNSQSVKSKV
jgi:hypothetical protein